MREHCRPASGSSPVERRTQLVYTLAVLRPHLTNSTIIVPSHPKFPQIPTPLQQQFHDRIAQLVYTFPEDAVTSTGSLFWSAPKRYVLLVLIHTLSYCLCA